MADIISLDNKLQLAKLRKGERIRKSKLLAVKKVFQCTHCSFKCEKCGTQINADQTGEENTIRSLRIPYRFCESCAEEYIDYIDRLKGEGDPNCYWHNDEWIGAWQKWIEYQGSMDRYMKSKAFLKLIKELQVTHPEE